MLDTIMKKTLLYITLTFAIQNLFGQIPITSLLTIEQGVIDVNSFEFWLEKGGEKSQYFNYDRFSESRTGSFYSNTNLFAFTDRDVKSGKYTLNIKLLTTDSTYHHQTEIDLSDNVIGASIVSLIGKSKSDVVYLKDLRVVRHVLPPKEIKLKPLTGLKLNKSPKFEIISEQTVSVYPYNHFGHFYGNIYKQTNGEWKTYGYVQPYQGFDCSPEYKISDDSTVTCFFTIKADCSRELIKEKGVYKFKIDIGTDELDLVIPDNYIEVAKLRLREFEYYTMEYIFEIK